MVKYIIFLVIGAVIGYYIGNKAVAGQGQQLGEGSIE